MQIRKGSKYLILYIVIFTALPPFAIDTYIPAFGNISNFFGISVESVATTVSIYLVGFGLGLLFWGALSDRYGRKNILILGMIIYIISTILCSKSSSFDMLLYMRFIQGFGDAPAAVAAMAILKDCYRGQKLIKCMATMVMVFMIAPIVAPIIGSVIIYTTGEWQNIFHFLTIYGFILLGLAFFMPETHNNNKRASSITQSFAVYLKHLSNKYFILGSVVGGLSFGALFSFISVSSNIIIVQFHLGYVYYCILFAINILGIVFASYTIKHKITRDNQLKFICTGYSISFVFLILNVICSYFFDNIYIFVLLNTVSTACFAFINIIISSKILDLLKEGFATAGAVNRLIKFCVGGIASFILTYSSVSALMINIPIQQLLLIAISALILFNIRKKIFF